jgi:hypothetical protein
LGLSGTVTGKRYGSDIRSRKISITKNISAKGEFPCPSPMTLARRLNTRVNIVNLLTESEFRQIETLQTTAAIVFWSSFLVLVAMVLLDCTLPALFLGE